MTYRATGSVVLGSMEDDMEIIDMVAVVIGVYGFGLCVRLLVWADHRTHTEIAWRRYRHWCGYRLNH